MKNILFTLLFCLISALSFSQKLYFDEDKDAIIIGNKIIPQGSVRIEVSTDSTSITITGMDNTTLLAKRNVTYLTKSDGSYYTDIYDLLDALDANFFQGQKEIDAWIQDQSTPPFHRYFMTYDNDSIELQTSVAKDAYTFLATSGNGFTATGEYALIKYGNYTQQSLVTNVSNDTITIESQVGVALPVVGTQIIRGSIEMNVNGSVTPIQFFCKIGDNASAVDIQHLHIFMLDDSDGDTDTYGGLTKLTKGTFVRYTTSTVCINLGNYKTNGDFVQFGADATYNEKAPAGEYSFDFSYELKKVYGIIFRLTSDDTICVTIQSNLTGLTLHRMVATGHIVIE